MLSCSSPKPFEIKDVCAQSEGTKVITQGYLSLPKTIDTIQLTKGGAITAVGYQIFLMIKADATGDAVKVTIWMITKAEPNKIKPFSQNYTWNDLLVYTDDGKEVDEGVYEYHPSSDSTYFYDLKILNDGSFFVV